MNKELEMVESGSISPDFALELARGNIKWMSFQHISWKVNVTATPTIIVSYQIPAWKTWYVTQGIMSTGAWKEVLIEFQYSSDWVTWTTVHSLYCYETNYQYKFTIPLRMLAWYYIRALWTDWATTANTTASFDLILIDNSIE